MKLKSLYTWRSAITDSELAPKARHVALTLSLHMNERGDSCWPAVQTIASETGLSKRTVQDSIAMLVEDGYLLRELGGGRSRSSHYRAQIPSPAQRLHDAAAEKVERVVPKERPRDPIWDAFVAVFGEPATESERGQLNRAVKELRDADQPAAEIPQRAARYRQEWPEVEMTPSALVKHWSRFNGSYGRRRMSPESAEAWVRSVGYGYPDETLAEELGKRWRLGRQAMQPLLELAHQIQGAV